MKTKSRAPSNQLMTAAEVADVLRINVNALYNLVAAGGIPHMRLGPKLIRFERSALDAWIAEQSAAGMSR